MCGITGIWEFEGKLDKKLLRKMSNVISHRGPDDEGFYTNGSIGLANRRLSIIDLTTGKQPIHNEDETVWIVFNGEIYNFQELREDLEKKGHRFYTNTDTEIIIHLYEDKGFESVKYLNGMFAFAIYDEKKKLLFLARDRIGIKPINYYIDENKFLFSSEIKSILENKTIKRSVNKTALNQYMAFEYVPTPLTMFENIYKLPPACFMVIKDKKLAVTQYWDLRFNPANKDESYFEKKLVEVLKKSVNQQLVADVPLGAFLSGGVDSSSVVAMMSQLVEEPVKTFTINFEEPGYGEGKYAQKVADLFGTDHHEETLSQNDIIKLIEKKEVFTDEPFTDPSIFPTYLVSKLARKNVTVSLSGDGGDELFAGYDWHLAEKLYPIYRAIPGKRLIAPLISFMPLQKQKKRPYQ
ncbi:MAG: asparagine synthase (glutamine-hydrolyzing) [archaeon]